MMRIIAASLFMMEYSFAFWDEDILHDTMPSALMMELEILYLLHNFAENIRAVFRRITILNETHFYVKLQLIPD